MRDLRIIIAVQGEGRGHLTQAIAIKQILEQQGHLVCGIIAGSNPEKPLPDFFLQSTDVPLLQVRSPHFSMNRKGNAIHMPATIFQNLRRMGAYIHSIRQMHEFITVHQPDILINLYEPLVAMYTLSYVRNFEIIAIAHQYIYLNPAFRFPKGFALQSKFLKYYTKFTAIGAKKILALSMYDLPASGSRLVVTPPALRQNLLNKTTGDDDFILIYIINSQFMVEVIHWHRKNPKVNLVCFTDNRDVRERHKGTYRIDEHLVFHSLHQEKFLDLMSRCSALVCTAGFESVCEAIYLGKPVMLIPVEGHYEQYCNARDTERIGAGIHSCRFDFDPAVIQSLEQSFPGASFKTWVESFPGQLNKTIREITTSKAWGYESLEA